MKLYDKAKTKYKRALAHIHNISMKLMEQIRDKQFRSKFKISIGLIVFIGLIYAIESTFLSVDTRQKAIIGISFQLFAGVVLALDQIVANAFKKDVDIWKWLGEKSMRVSAVACLPLSLAGALVYGAWSTGWETDLGVIIFTIILFTFYSYAFVYYITKADNMLKKRKGRKKDGIESNIGWANLILCSLTLTLTLITGLLNKYTQVPAMWNIVSAWIILPMFLFSFSFFLVAGILKGILLLRQKLNRAVFWVAILVIWSWGGLLLLVSACAS